MPRRTSRPYSAPAIIFLAFILLFLACISVPFAQGIRLFTLVDHNTGGSIRFGLWGYCLSKSINGYPQCTVPEVGWTFNNVPTLTGLEGSTSARLTSALIIHPIVTVCTFILFLLTAVFVFKPSFPRKLSAKLGQKSSFDYIAPTLTFIAAILTSVAFIMDVIVIADVKRRVSQASGTARNMTANMGAIVWLSVIAAVVLWIVTVMLCLIHLDKRSRARRAYDDSGSAWDSDTSSRRRDTPTRSVRSSFSKQPSEYSMHSRAASVSHAYSDDDLRQATSSRRSYSRRGSQSSFDADNEYDDDVSQKSKRPGFFAACCPCLGRKRGGSRDTDRDTDEREEDIELGDLGRSGSRRDVEAYDTGSDNLRRSRSVDDVVYDSERAEDSPWNSKSDIGRDYEGNRGMTDEGTRRASEEYTSGDHSFDERTRDLSDRRSGVSSERDGGYSEGSRRDSDEYSDEPVHDRTNSRDISESERIDTSSIYSEREPGYSESQYERSRAGGSSVPSSYGSDNVSRYSRSQSERRTRSPAESERYSRDYDSDAQHSNYDEASSQHSRSRGMSDDDASRYSRSRLSSEHCASEHTEEPPLASGSYIESSYDRSENRSITEEESMPRQSAESEEYLSDRGSERSVSGDELISSEGEGDQRTSDGHSSVYPVGDDVHSEESQYDTDRRGSLTDERDDNSRDISDTEGMYTDTNADTADEPQYSDNYERSESLKDGTVSEAPVPTSDYDSRTNDYSGVDSQGESHHSQYEESENLLDATASENNSLVSDHSREISTEDGGATLTPSEREDSEVHSSVYPEDDDYRDHTDEERDLTDGSGYGSKEASEIEGIATNSNMDTENDSRNSTNTYKDSEDLRDATEASVPASDYDSRANDYSNVDSQSESHHSQYEESENLLDATASENNSLVSDHSRGISTEDEGATLTPSEREDSEVHSSVYPEDDDYHDHTDEERDLTDGSGYGSKEASEIEGIGTNSNMDTENESHNSTNTYKDSEDLRDATEASVPASDYDSRANGNSSVDSQSESHHSQYEESEGLPDATASENNSLVSDHSREISTEDGGATLTLSEREDSEVHSSVYTGDGDYPEESQHDTDGEGHSTDYESSRGISGTDIDIHTENDSQISTNTHENSEDLRDATEASVPASDYDSRANDYSNVDSQSESHHSQYEESENLPDATASENNSLVSDHSREISAEDEGTALTPSEREDSEVHSSVYPEDDDYHDHTDEERDLTDDSDDGSKEASEIEGIGTNSNMDTENDSRNSTNTYKDSEDMRDATEASVPASDYDSRANGGSSVGSQSESHHSQYEESEGLPDATASENSSLVSDHSRGISTEDEGATLTPSEREDSEVHSSVYPEDDDYHDHTDEERDLTDNSGYGSKEASDIEGIGTNSNMDTENDSHNSTNTYKDSEDLRDATEASVPASDYDSRAIDHSNADSQSESHRSQSSLVSDHSRGTSAEDEGTALTPSEREDSEVHSSIYPGDGNYPEESQHDTDGEGHSTDYESNRSISDTDIDIHTENDSQISTNTHENSEDLRDATEASVPASDYDSRANDYSNVDSQSESHHSQYEESENLLDATTSENNSLVSDHSREISTEDGGATLTPSEREDSEVHSSVYPEDDDYRDHTDEERDLTDDSDDGSKEVSDIEGTGTNSNMDTENESRNSTNTHEGSKDLRDATEASVSASDYDSRANDYSGVDSQSESHHSQYEESEGLPNVTASENSSLVSDHSREISTEDGGATLTPSEREDSEVHSSVYPGDDDYRDHTDEERDLTDGSGYGSKEASEIEGIATNSNMDTENESRNSTNTYKDSEDLRDATEASVSASDYDSRTNGGSSVDSQSESHHSQYEESENLPDATASENNSLVSDHSRGISAEDGGATLTPSEREDSEVHSSVYTGDGDYPEESQQDTDGEGHSTDYESNRSIPDTDIDIHTENDSQISTNTHENSEDLRDATEASVPASDYDSRANDYSNVDSQSESHHSQYEESENLPDTTTSENNSLVSDHSREISAEDEGTALTPSEREDSEVHSSVYPEDDDYRDHTDEERDLTDDSDDGSKEASEIEGIGTNSNMDIENESRNSTNTHEDSKDLRDATEASVSASDYDSRAIDHSNADSQSESHRSQSSLVSDHSRGISAEDEGATLTPSEREDSEVHSSVYPEDDDYHDHTDEERDLTDNSGYGSKEASDIEGIGTNSNMDTENESHNSTNTYKDSEDLRDATEASVPASDYDSRANDYSNVDSQSESHRSQSSLVSDHSRGISAEDEGTAPTSSESEGYQRTSDAPSSVHPDESDDYRDSSKLYTDREDEPEHESNRGVSGTERTNTDYEDREDLLDTRTAEASAPSSHYGSERLTSYSQSQTDLDSPGSEVFSRGEGSHTDFLTGSDKPTSDEEHRSGSDDYFENRNASAMSDASRYPDSKLSSGHHTSEHTEQSPLYSEPESRIITDEGTRRASEEYTSGDHSFDERTRDLSDRRSAVSSERDGGYSEGSRRNSDEYSDEPVHDRTNSRDISESERIDTSSIYSEREPGYSESQYERSRAGGSSVPSSYGSDNVSRYSRSQSERGTGSPAESERYSRDYDTDADVRRRSDDSRSVPGEEYASNLDYDEASPRGSENTTNISHSDTSRYSSSKPLSDRYPDPYRSTDGYISSSVPDEVYSSRTSASEPCSDHQNFAGGYVPDLRSSKTHSDDAYSDQQSDSRPLSEFDGDSQDESVYPEGSRMSNSEFGGLGVPVNSGEPDHMCSGREDESLMGMQSSVEEFSDTDEGKRDGGGNDSDDEIIPRICEYCGTYIYA